MVPCSRPLPARHRWGGRALPCQKPARSWWSRAGSSAVADLASISPLPHSQRTVLLKGKCEFKERHTANYFYWLHSTLTIFMFNMPSSAHTCQDHFSSRALTERAEKQIKQMEKPKYQWVPAGHHLAAVRHDSREVTWGHTWSGTLPWSLQECLRRPWADRERYMTRLHEKQEILTGILQLLYNSSFCLLSVHC